MTEYQKMQNGMLYDCLDEEIGREQNKKSIMKSREAR